MFKDLDLDKIIQSIHVIDKYKFKIYDKMDRKKVQKNIIEIIKNYRVPGTHHEYSRAIGNAMAYGSCPVDCEIYIGDDRQLICVIKDSGNGFDYKGVIKKFMNKEIYYHGHGRGTRSYACNKYLYVDWKDQGKTIILYYNKLHKDIL